MWHFLLTIGHYGCCVVYEETDGRADAPRFRLHGVTTSDGQPAGAPPGYRVVTVKTASVPELRDLTSFRRDLELAAVYAEAFASHIAQHGPSNSRDPLLGLWNAALISYGRAFNGGVRDKARVLTDKLDARELESHAYFLDLRNKHVAHAVNGYEDTTVIAYLTDSAFTPRAVTRTGQMHTEQIFNPETAPVELGALCAKLIDEINKRVRTLHYLIARELAEMGIEKVYAFPNTSMPAEADVKKSRRRK